MLDALANIGLQLAPELGAAGLRVILHQPDWPIPPSVLAYVAKGRHLAAREYLRSIGTWPGHWPAIILLVRPPASVTEALPVVIHELAHCLPASPPLADIEPSDSERKMQALQLATWSARKVQDSEPWAGHDARFVRRCCHLRYRAAWLGIDIDLTAANVAGRNYGLSHPSMYEEALATEPQRLRLKTFSEIDSGPVPKRFARLFSQDVAEWHFYQLTEGEQTK